MNISVGTVLKNTVTGETLTVSKTSSGGVYDQGRELRPAYFAANVRAEGKPDEEEQTFLVISPMPSEEA